MEQSSHSQQLHVTELYQGASVLITGGSGFLGKILLEKLLFSQPEIHTIYLLIRPLKEDDSNARLATMLKSPIFNRIRCVDEDRFKKLKPINGDLMQDGMGLSDQDRETLINEITVVFHCAATVKFDEALRVSIKMNVLGTLQLTALCRRMKKLLTIVHASTAYANCNLPATEERIYEPPVNATKLIEAMTWMSNEMLDSISGQLLQGRPNTYTFAKALAESQLNEEQHRHPLPIIIVRPSIIGAIWKEPLPGWIDNVNGPTGIFLGVGKGLLTDMCGDDDSNADIIPVDIVANMLIVAAAYRAKMSITNDIPIIHCTSGELNPLKWGRIVVLLEQFCLTYPFEQCYRVPSTQFHRRRKLFAFNFFAKHYALARAIDLCYRIVGKKPRFLPIYNKIWKMIETLHYFTTRGWTFESENAVKLWNCMAEEDRKLYNFDVRKVDWEKYLFDYLMGVKLYLLKERLEDLPKSQASLLWLKQLNLYLNGMFFALSVRLFAWHRPKRQKWALFLSGFLLTYVYQNFNGFLRPKLYLPTLEEYKRTSLPHYLEYDQKTGNP